MAEEKNEQPAAAAPAAKQSPRSTKNILLIGVPAFLVQLVLVYFLTAKFLVPISLKNAAAASPQNPSEASHAVPAHDESETQEEFLFVIKDLIINPAGTNGQRYLLTTIGFNVSSEAARKEMEKKELAVRDALNSILTSKTMDDLIDVSKREMLRHEIYERCKELIKSGKLQSVYFSKYIIQ